MEQMARGAAEHARREAAAAEQEAAIVQAVAAARAEMQSRLDEQVARSQPSSFHLARSRAFVASPILLYLA